MKISRLKLSWLLLSTSLVACNTVYVEQETPPGRVVAPIPRANIKPLTTSLIDSGTMEPEYSLDSSFSYDSQLSKHTTSQLFSVAYKKAKSPKIALLLYRELSQDILDHGSRQRITFSGINTGNRSNRNVDIEVSSNVDSGTRFLPTTGWAWRFENSLMDDLLASGVQLIDRATVMRLLAADVDVAIDSSGMLSVKKIETDALKGKVDIFIEILAIPSLEPGRQYDYKAVAKQIKTGRIIASVLTLGKTTNAEEYSIGNVSDTIGPDLIQPSNNSVQAEKTAAWLSQAVKAKLVAFWESSY